ncbi:bifunctional 3'-5' exonuclease/DNA polymerase [Saccharomonospora xinjiangensis]|uniref:bifunctional 3'-5' exonuclease/DNA polymerase n=1 Tax=Saccharomonospora xinjiangensis TaxID=75294 RepID=UPI00106FB79C|nr:bifunctional 3'-5' exonuclease/DNA polymerase [Saccharomonospora xinjiangensis]QBQ59821.1 DNA polymerase I, thermostable [Saccharomonospora xinjiangensis]
MRIIVARQPDGGYLVRPSTPIPGARKGGLHAAEAAALIRRWEREHEPRWVFTSVEHDYPPLIADGVRIGRCLDLALTESLLLAHAGRHGESRSLSSAYARAKGLPPPLAADSGPADDGDEPTLFDLHHSGLPPGADPGEAAEVVLHDQEQRIRDLPHPDRMRLLVAAEAASALAAVEMSADGLPWRADVHRRLLTDLLGPRVPSGQRPRRLAELAERITSAFGGRPVNPDAPGSIVRALRRDGVEVASARAHVLRRIDHPAIAPLLEYKELARLHSAHGWSWLDQWVRDDRFRGVYVVGGVVSGRWASRGGAALQIPKMLRECVRADEGWTLVVADAAQLEPRVLAALSGDRRLAEVSASADLYASLASTMFGRTPRGDDRDRAKIAMLSAMYGGVAGEAASLLALLRRRFPHAVSYVEHAALQGERGGTVRSRLGRTSPPPSEEWRTLTGGTGDEETARRVARDWGRFTRNFVVQASAADWTAVFLAMLRRRLPAPAHLVFFQHDEVLVHCPAELADRVTRELAGAAKETTTLVFGPSCPVRFPMPTTAVEVYADAP